MHTPIHLSLLVTDDPRHRLGRDIRQMTIGRALAEQAGRRGDKVFLHDLPGDRRYTYREVDEASNRLANGMRDAGIGAGTHVAVLSDNRPEALFAYLALAKLGAVAVPVNTAARGDLLRYLLAHSDCTALVADAECLEHAEAVHDDLPALATLIHIDAPDRPVSQRWTQVRGLEQFDAHSATPPAHDVRFSELGAIFYTSGTTGPSKGVMFSQARMLLWGLSHIEAFGYTEDDIAYVCLPLFHVNALLGATYMALSAGASVAMQRRFSASGFWPDVRKSGATVSSMLGSMANILWSQPASSEDSVNPLRLSQVTPIPEFARAFEARFGMRFVSSYGLTDYGASHAYTIGDPDSKLGSCGRTRRGYEARIVDADEFELPAGEVGELVLRCNNPWEVSPGYYKMPQATIDSMRGGWFHTGDRGSIDAEGYFWFVDRLKDSIRRRGENISAYEIELVVLKHPAIADAAAFPVRSPLGEDDVAIAVSIRKDMTLTERELVAYCEARMARHMVPRYVQLLADLPRNASQKVDKLALRRHAEHDLSRIWDREREGAA